MIYVIETKKPHHFISAISKDKALLEAYLNSFPKAVKKDSKLLELDLNYPFRIVERQGFKFFDEANLLKNVTLAAKELKDDQEIFNLYRICEDFFPDQPGQDEMGILEHEHFTKQETREWLALLKK